jgi:hypothetical protein
MMLTWIADSEPPPTVGVMATDIQIFAKDADPHPATTPTRVSEGRESAPACLQARRSMTIPTTQLTRTTTTLAMNTVTARGFRPPQPDLLPVAPLLISAGVAVVS